MLFRRHFLDARRGETESIRVVQDQSVTTWPRLIFTLPGAVILVPLDGRGSVARDHDVHVAVVCAIGVSSTRAEESAASLVDARREMLPHGPALSTSTATTTKGVLPSGTSSSWAAKEWDPSASYQYRSLSPPASTSICVDINH